MSRRPPIILWDIDGTLVRGKGGRVSMNAFVRALQRASKLEHTLVYPADVSGKTDSQIAREVLAAIKMADADATAALELFGPTYLAELEAERERLLDDTLVLPGVPEILRRLQQLGVTQSLLTGNLEPVARLKLGLTGLDQFIDFHMGAFGSDHADRNCLVPIARERARQRLGNDVAPDEVIVVGDTPRDIACARAGGARVVAVATGNYSRDELAAHAPDAVLDELSDTAAVTAELLRYSSYSGQADTQALIV